MKYYKVLKNGYASTGSLAEVGVILPEDYRADRYWCTNLAGFVNKYPEDFQEVSEEEYLKQEGKIEEFKLPEKWCVFIKKENLHKVKPYYDHLLPYNSFYIYSREVQKGFHKYDKRTGGGKLSEYTEITFEQFKKYVLKEEQMDKKIIGYKLIKPEYEKAAAELIYGGNKIHGLVQVEREWDILKEAGVLDLWFEPVYEEQFKVGDWVVFEAERVKEEYPRYYTDTWNKEYVLKVDELDREHEALIFINQMGKSSMGNKYFCFRKATPEEIKKAQVPDITINGYKAEFFDTHVQFGCACISKTQFQGALSLIEMKSPYSNREVESVTIGKGTFTKEQIRQIVEYYKNK